MMCTARSGTVGRFRRALSLIETVFSVVLVGGLAVVAMNTVGSSVVGRSGTATGGKGELLAQDLMAEILARPYEDPDETPTFGRESSESGSDRAGYDDVDDYDGWVSSPPENRDGTLMPDLTGWSREVTVEWAEPTDLTATSGTDQGIKRITVTVKRNGKVAATLVALRNRATDNAKE